MRQKFRKTYGFPDGPERPPLVIPLGTPPVSLALGCGSWGGPPPTGGPPVGAPTENNKGKVKHRTTDNPGPFTKKYTVHTFAYHRGSRRIASRRWNQTDRRVAG